MVFATGWDNARELARPILGDEFTDQLSPIWGLDEFGEINGTFRESGHPHLWFIVGSTGLVRGYSKYLALQILAREVGAITS